MLQLLAGGVKMKEYFGNKVIKTLSFSTLPASIWSITFKRYCCAVLVGKQSQK